MPLTVLDFEVEHEAIAAPAVPPRRPCLAELHKELRALIGAHSLEQALALCRSFLTDETQLASLQGDVQGDDDLARISGLHPLVQTLVLAVSDIYAHRLAESLKLHDAELLCMLQATLGMAQHARKTAAAVRDTMAECQTRIMDDIDHSFFQQHRIQLQNLHVSRAAMHEELLARCSGSLDAIRTALPLRSLPPLPEPLPWSQLEARMAEWQAQRRRAMHLQEATHTRVNGVELSRLLEPVQTRAPLASKAPTAPSWNRVLAETTKVSAEAWSQAAAAASTPAWLFARLCQARGAGKESANLIEAYLSQRATQIVEQYAGQARGAEDATRAELARRRTELAKSSAAGEAALQRELRASTAGNEYTWRAVQRAVQAIFVNYEAGLTKAMRAADRRHFAQLQEGLEKATQT